MAQLMFPDVAGSFQQGFQNGQNMQFNRLAGAAMQNPDQRAQLLGQAGAINPGAALQIQGVYAQQAEQRQAAQRAQQADAMKKIGGAARYMLSALQTKDPNQIEGAYQAVRPYLAELGQAQGKTPPPNWDPSMVPAIYLAAAATASAFPDDNKLYNLAPGGQLVNGSGNTVASAPFKPTPPIVNNGYQLTLGPDGKYTAGQIPIGAQNGVGVDQAVSGAPPGGQKVLFNFAPGTPPEVIAAAKAEAQAAGDIPPSAQPQTLAGAIAAQKSHEGTDAGALSDDAQQMLAAAAAQGYKVPIPAFGMRNSTARIDYLNALAQRIKESGQDWTTGVHNMVYGETGITGSKAAQRIFGQTLANERAVEQQVPTILGLSSKVSRTGVPVFNKWILAGRQQISGDPDVTAFNNGVKEFAEEYAKVMSGSPTGAATDSARALAHTLISSAMTPDQFAHVMQTMETMMQQRVQGQRSGINEQISGLANSGGFTQTPQQAQPRAVNPQTGQAVVWNGTAWVPEQ